MKAHCPPEERLEQLLDDRLEATADAALAGHVRPRTAATARRHTGTTPSASVLPEFPSGSHRKCCSKRFASSTEMAHEPARPAGGAPGAAPR